MSGAGQKSSKCPLLCETEEERTAMAAVTSGITRNVGRQFLTVLVSWFHDVYRLYFRIKSFEKTSSTYINPLAPEFPFKF